MLAGCAGTLEGPPGGGPAGSVGGNTGTLVLFGEDQPAGDVLAFELTLSGATLTDSRGGTVSVLPAPVELEWRSRGLAPTVLSVTEVPPATYTQLTVILAVPEMTIFDPLTSTFPEINPPLSVSAVDLPIDLVIASGEVAGLRLDLDLRSSVQLDASNNFVINPVFAAVPTSFVVGQLPGDIDDALGTVGELDVPNDKFTFTVLPANETLAVPVDGATLFEVVSDLSALQAGNAIELDARLQPGGDFLAQEIERETPGTSQQLRGLVLARTPAINDLTSLELLVLEEIPDTTAFDAGDVVTVTVDAFSSFRISTEDLPVVVFPTLDFSGQSVRPGQFIHVVQRPGAPGFTADVIALKEISLVGRVGLGVGTTTFAFLPDGDFFSLNGLGQITVVVTPVTELEDMPAALGSLQPNQSIVGVRGVLVVQAGSGVLVAKRVRLLQP